MRCGVKYIFAFDLKGSLFGIFTGYTDAAKATGLQADYVHRIVHGKNKVNQCKGYTFVGVRRMPRQPKIDEMSLRVKMFFEMRGMSFHEFVNK